MDEVKKILKDTLKSYHTDLADTLRAYNTELDSVTKTITDRQERTKKAAESLETQFSAYKTRLETLNTTTQKNLASQAEVNKTLLEIPRAKNAQVVKQTPDPSLTHQRDKQAQLS